LRITREGRRYKKLETIQLWRCHDCDRVFTPQIAKGESFPRRDGELYLKRLDG